MPYKRRSEKYPIDWEIQVRICSECHIEKPFTDYIVSRKYPRPQCRLCMNAAKVIRYNSDLSFKFSQIAHSQNRAVNLKFGITDRITAAFVEKILTSSECTYCKLPNTSDTIFHLDHVIPLSKGGSHTEDNIVAACEFCNMAKQDNSKEEYIVWLKGVVKRLRN